eukprot:15842954-Heterocapsa_arctica.AAC.1
MSLAQVTPMRLLICLRASLTSSIAFPWQTILKTVGPPVIHWMVVLRGRARCKVLLVGATTAIIDPWVVLVGPWMSMGPPRTLTSQVVCRYLVPHCLAARA